MRVGEGESAHERGREATNKHTPEQASESAAAQTSMPSSPHSPQHERTQRPLLQGEEAQLSSLSGDVPPEREGERERGGEGGRE